MELKYIGVDVVCDADLTAIEEAWMLRVVSAALIAAAATIGSGLSAPAGASDAWTGNYSGRKGSYRWQATIRERSAGVYALHASVGSDMPACAGELDTTARSSGDRLIVDDKDCSLTIAKRGAAGIRIEEKQCLTWHGAACEFTSVLARR